MNIYLFLFSRALFPRMERVMRFELMTATLATWNSTTELHPHMVPAEGLEPPTYGLQNRCTAICAMSADPFNYVPIKDKYQWFFAFLIWYTILT